MLILAMPAKTTSTVRVIPMKMQKIMTMMTMMKKKMPAIPKMGMKTIWGLKMGKMWTTVMRRTAVIFRSNTCMKSLSSRLVPNFFESGSKSEM